MDTFLSTEKIFLFLGVFFVVCILVITAILLDLWDGVHTARKTGQRVHSHKLRVTIAKMSEYCHRFFGGLPRLLFQFLLDAVCRDTVWRGADSGGGKVDVRARKAPQEPFDGTARHHRRNREVRPRKGGT